MRRMIMLLLLLVLTGLLVASRFYPKVERIEVTGESHYSEEEILMLADLAPGDPFFWVNRWSLAPLADDPWILHLRVLRHWPDTISVRVWERRPAVSDGRKVYAKDGTVLPNAKRDDTLVRLEGWGGERTREALQLIRLLAEFEPEVLSYSPGGFEVRLAEAWLFTPSLAALKEHWAAFLGQPGGNVAVYPWGVSVEP